MHIAHSKHIHHTSPGRAAALDQTAISPIGLSDQNIAVYWYNDIDWWRHQSQTELTTCHRSLARRPQVGVRAVAEIRLVSVSVTACQLTALFDLFVLEIALSNFTGDCRRWHYSGLICVHPSSAQCFSLGYESVSSWRKRWQESLRRNMIKKNWYGLISHIDPHCALLFISFLRLELRFTKQGRKI